MAEADDLQQALLLLVSFAHGRPAESGAYLAGAWVDTSTPWRIKDLHPALAPRGNTTCPSCGGPADQEIYQSNRPGKEPKTVTILRCLRRRFRDVAPCAVKVIE